jgi:hypothetical protein
VGRHTPNPSKEGSSPQRLQRNSLLAVSRIVPFAERGRSCRSPSSVAATAEGGRDEFHHNTLMPGLLVMKAHVRPAFYEDVAREEFWLHEHDGIRD